MKRDTRSITLVETLIVIAIGLILVSLLVAAVVPGAKRSAMETRIRSDLRQIASALAIYRADYDDELPPRLESLPTGTPIAIDNFPQRSQYCPECIVGTAAYRLSYTGRMKRLQAYYKIPFEFDETKYAIVDAPFYQKETGSFIRMPWPTQGGGTRMMKVPLKRVLGVKTDGSVFWKPLDDDWEWGMLRYGLAPLPHDQP